MSKKDLSPSVCAIDWREPDHVGVVTICMPYGRSADAYLMRVAIGSEGFSAYGTCATLVRLADLQPMTHRALGFQTAEAAPTQ